MYPSDGAHVRLQSLRNQACLGVVRSKPNVYEISCKLSPNSPFATFSLHRLDINTIMLQSVEFPLCWLCVDTAHVSALGSAESNCRLALRILDDHSFMMCPASNPDAVIAVYQDGGLCVASSAPDGRKDHLFRFLPGKQ